MLIVQDSCIILKYIFPFRIYVFNDSSAELLTSLDCDKHCVLTVKIRECYFKDSCRIFVFSTATNGLVYIWNITSLLGKYVEILLQLIFKKVVHDDDKTLRSSNKFIKLNDNLERPLDANDEIESEIESEDKNTYEHINKNKYKFHDLNVPLWNFDGESIKVSTHQSGVNAIDIYEIADGMF